MCAMLRMVWWTTLAWLTAGVGVTSHAAATPPEVSVDQVIEFYTQKVQQHPTVFAAHAALGAAYLDKARETHEVQWLGKARAALQRSIELQPDLNAFLTMAALCNFSHRFACALEYADRAARAHPGDASLLPLRVEAYLGLGQLDAAQKLLAKALQAGNPSFAALGAQGRWFAEQSRFDEAHDNFVAAAKQARAEGANDMVIWAETNAAGMYIDSKRPQPARAHLDAAAALETKSWPIAAVLQVHLAEWDDLEGRSEQALRRYQSILERQADPEMFRRAFVLAQKLGRQEQAAQLLSAGEAAAEKVLAAGEIFALEAQARLYADAGVKLDRAEQLAKQNLQHKQDRSARETMAYVEQRIKEGTASH
jgi:tetratricopeptide (TPR) repeat protein